MAASTRAATRASNPPQQTPSYNSFNPTKGDGPWRESSFYKEALDNMVLYNSQLSRQRKSRLPYYDVQTGIAQRDCHLWVDTHHRHKGDLPGQLYSYTRRRWRLEDPKSIQEMTKVPEPVIVENTSNGSSGGLVQAMEGGVVTKRSTRIAGLKKEDTVVVPSNRVLMESPISSEMNEEDSDKDQDFIDDYDSEEERRPSKKRKRNTRTRTITAPHKYSASSKEQEKPYVCSMCNRRYKTQASLKAHQTQYHAIEATPPPPSQPSKLDDSKSSREATPSVSSTTVSSGGGVNLKKRNPYCDFCLGDDNMNRKSGKSEKMVSCADCGRSAHPSCLQFSAELSSVVSTYRWQCIECKSCSLCGKSDNDDQLLFCDDCDRGYHMYCLTPPMKEAPEGSWSCGMCKRFKPGTAAATTPGNGVPLPPYNKKLNDH